jgi:hypothetical protein
MMIEAEMYGIIPNAKTLKRINAPPENMLKSPTILFCWALNNSCKRCGFNPGTGIYEPILNTSIANKRNSNLAFKSANPAEL